jgi:hypothetical protein
MKSPQRRNVMGSLWKVIVDITIIIITKGKCGGK